MCFAFVLFYFIFVRLVCGLLGSLLLVMLVCFGLVGYMFGLLMLFVIVGCSLLGLIAFTYAFSLFIVFKCCLLVGGGLWIEIVPVAYCLCLGLWLFGLIVWVVLLLWIDCGYICFDCFGYLIIVYAGYISFIIVKV